MFRYRFYPQYNVNGSGGSPSAVSTKMLFDVNDASTMTVPKDRSTRWKRVSAIVNSSRFGVVTVYDNSFGADEVLNDARKGLVTMLKKVDGDWSVHTHCDFCGEKVIYVALIVGLNGGDSTVYHIGCDCVGKIFGVRWFGYRNADSARKTLVEAAAKRRRAMEYPQKYASELAWLDSLPEFILSKNGFLGDMKKLLRTGDRKFTPKMENYLRSLMKRKEYDPKEFAHAKIEYEQTVEKIESIKKLVESVDDTDEKKYSKYSAWSFVDSVLTNYKQWRRPLTQGQMNALNKVFVRYRGMQTKVHVAVPMKGDPNEIPW